MDIEKKREENIVTLEVEIEKEKVADALQKAYKKVVKDVEIPGFRKGKVPRKILEKKYGEEVLHKDALDILIPQAYHEVIQEEEIEPVAQPDVTDVFIEKDKPVTFTAEVKVKPEVELSEYTGLDVEKPEVEITDEQIEAELEAKREEHAQLVVADRDEVEDGDYVVIDFEGKIDGEVFPGGTAEDYNLEIGSGSFIPGFEEKLIGVKKDEEVELELTFPEDYQADDLAGEEVVFTVLVKEIKTKDMPELNDEFAKDIGFDSLDEAKEDIKNELYEEKKEQVDRNFENEVIEKVVEGMEVDIPDEMIEDEIDNMMQRFKTQVSQQGMDFEQYLEASGMSEADLKENYREQAEDSVKANLALEAIAELEDIEVTEEEIDEQVEKIAEEQDQDKEMIKSFLQMQGQLDQLKTSLQSQKVIEFLAENN